VKSAGWTQRLRPPGRKRAKVCRIVKEKHARREARRAIVTPDGRFSRNTIFGC
jgi:hypothetical protein